MLLPLPDNVGLSRKSLPATNALAYSAGNDEEKKVL